MVVSCPHYAASPCPLEIPDGHNIHLCNAVLLGEAKGASLLAVRRLLIALLAMLLAVPATGACSRAEAAGSARLLVFGAPEELAAYRKLVEAFTKAQPGNPIELIEASDRKDLLTRLSTSLSAGVPPELFLMNYRFYGQFAAKGAIEAVDKRLDGSQVIARDDFYPQAMSAFRWGGQQLCMPQNISSLVVYYNKDLFSRYQTKLPEPQWHWNDMVATAMALTRDANGNQVRGADPEVAPQPVALHGLGFDPEMIRIAPLVWSNGGEIVDDPVKPTRFTLDTPQAREALQAFLDLSVANGIVPSDVHVESESHESRFVNGRLAMLVSSRRPTTTFRGVSSFQWDVAPLPVFAKPANVLHSDAYCITKASRNKDLAWKFVEFALGPQGAAIMAGTGRTVPSTIKVAQSPAFLDLSRPPGNGQVFIDAIPHIRPMPAISTWPEIEDITGGILENALYHGENIDSVIAELDRQTRPIFQRASSG